jgi:hypothetical protein
MYKNGAHPHIAFAVFDEKTKDISGLKKFYSTKGISTVIGVS